MRAAVLYGPNTPLVVEEVEIAPPKAHEVLVRIAYSGVCHSDYHVVLGEWTQPMPIVLGHEAAGIVEAVGDGVRGVQPGDHVITSWIASCDTCFYCRSGQPQLCETVIPTAFERGTMQDGTSRLSLGGRPVASYLAVGSFAEYAVLPERGVCPIRKDMPLDKAALIGCAVATGVGAVINTARIEVGSTVLVIGCGGVGLSAIQGATLASARTIIAVDVHDDKLDVARTLGATHLINSAKADLVREVKELTGGRGVDYAFEAIGYVPTIQQAFEATRFGGTTVLVGLTPEGQTIAIDPFVLADREKIVRGCNYGSTRPVLDFPKLVDLYMAGKLRLDQMIGQTISLDGVNDAFALMGTGHGLRTLIRM